jgi:hypothetical protein
MNANLGDLIRKNQQQNQKSFDKKWKNDKFHQAQTESSGYLVQISNLHWNVTEQDLIQLFGYLVHNKVIQFFQ